MNNDVIIDGTFLCSMNIFSADNDSVIPVVKDAVKTPQTEIPIVIQTIPNNLAFSDFGVLSPYLKDNLCLIISQSSYQKQQLSHLKLVLIKHLQELNRKFDVQLK